MSYYDNQAWPGQGRQPSWEQPAPTPRSDAGSTVHRDDPVAFLCQFEEVDRAADNIAKSGKIFGGYMGRRDSVSSRPYSEYGSPSRHHSISDYDGLRSHSSSSLQGYYHNQRHSRHHNEMDTVLQAKRRMAAQRERELRNYHQEQQYNRSVLADMSGAKSDRSASPSGMTEEERRELIARQHRALYGNDAPLYGANAAARPISQDARVAAGVMRPSGNSPLNYEQFSIGTQGGQPEQMQTQPMGTKDASTTASQQRSRANSTASPSSNPAAFSLFEGAAQQSSHTSTSSPGASPPRQGMNKSSATGPVGTIGTRPPQSQAQAAGAGNTKRSTTPLPSPLSYGYSTSEHNHNINNNIATVPNSNPPSAMSDKAVGLGWPGNNGVWGPAKNPLGVQASVWG